MALLIPQSIFSDKFVAKPLNSLLQQIGRPLSLPLPCPRLHQCAEAFSPKLSFRPGGGEFWKFRNQGYGLLAMHVLGQEKIDFHKPIEHRHFEIGKIVQRQQQLFLVCLIPRPFLPVGRELHNVLHVGIGLRQLSILEGLAKRVAGKTPQVDFRLQIVGGVFDVEKGRGDEIRHRPFGKRLVGRKADTWGLIGVESEALR